MNIKINKMAKDLKIKMPDLITRPVGRRMFNKVETLLNYANENEVVIFDFDEIKVIDSSFIDEFIVKSIKYSIGASKNFFIKLKNISNIAEINIDSVFKTYSSYNKMKIAIVTDGICIGNNFYIGPLNEVEKEIMGYIRINKTATLENLQDYTGKESEELKKIMNNLNSLRLVRFNSVDFYESI